MKVRSALVNIEISGSKPAKTPHTAGGRRGAKLATAIAYPYVAEPIRVRAPRPSWPFARRTPSASLKPEKLVQLRVPEPGRKRTDETKVPAAAKLPVKAPPIQVPPPAGHTEPPRAPQFSAPAPSDPSLASTLDAPSSELRAETASLLESVSADAETTMPPGPPVDPPSTTVDAAPPADSQSDASILAADGGSHPEPCLDERTSRARIVETLWEDPIREQLEVNLGATTESNLYCDVDLRIANGGVFLATYQDLAPGTQVSLHITLAGGLATSAHGRVTLKRESLETFGDPAPGVCVAFELLSNEALALLEQFASIRTPWLIEDE